METTLKVQLNKIEDELSKLDELWYTAGCKALRDFYAIEIEKKQRAFYHLTGFAQQK